MPDRGVVSALVVILLIEVDLSRHMPHIPGNLYYDKTDKIGQ